MVGWLWFCNGRYHWHAAIDLGNKGVIRKMTRQESGISVSNWWKTATPEQIANARKKQSETQRGTTYERKKYIGAMALSSAFRSCFKGYKSQSGRRKILFDLTPDQFLEVTSRPCTYCNAPPSNRQRSWYPIGDTTLYLYSGLDRKDSAGAYTYSNVVPCCKICNFMKQEMSIAAFINHCKRIINFVENGGECNAVGPTIKE